MDTAGGVGRPVKCFPKSSFIHFATWGRALSRWKMTLPYLWGLFWSFSFNARFNITNCCRYRSPVIVSSSFSNSYYTALLLSQEIHSNTFFSCILRTSCDVEDWPGFFALSVVEIDSLSINRYWVDARSFPFCPVSKISQMVLHLSISLSSNSYRIQFFYFWIFFNVYRRSEIMDWVRFNISANCF